jgi:hypothetical protein
LDELGALVHQGLHLLPPAGPGGEVIFMPPQVCSVLWGITEKNLCLAWGKEVTIWE